MKSKWRFVIGLGVAALAFVWADVTGYLRIRSFADLGIAALSGLVGFVVEGYRLWLGRRYGRSRISTFVPGSTLTRIAQTVFPKKMYDRIFAELLADIEHEYLEALDKSRKWLGRWVHFRGVVCFWVTVVTACVASVVDLVSNINKLKKG